MGRLSQYPARPEVGVGECEGSIFEMASLRPRESGSGRRVCLSWSR